MEPITIQSHKGPYVVHFHDTPFPTLGGAEALDKAHFLVDDRVASLYAEPLAAVLGSGRVLRLEATERAKTLDRFTGYVEQLTEQGVRRDHRLVAIGGGIIQDITAFLAATLFRGMSWEFHPTTLLAQSDSCIGSKSSINVGDVKNLMGTFTPPRRIDVSTAVLKTLDERDLRSGIGEIIKVHVIAGPDHFGPLDAAADQLLRDDQVLLRFIRQSLQLKKRLIEEDEFDQGIRNVMNYGHSFGHAIEAATAFGIPHGIAVTMGMDMANHAAVVLGRMDGEHYARMHPMMRKNWDGFEGTDIPMEPFLRAISRDKKNQGADLTLILPDREAIPQRVRVPNDARFRDLCADWFATRRAS